MNSKVLMAFLGLSLGVFVFGANPAHAAAATLYVDDAACPGAGTGTKIDPFCTITAAITAAAAGDTIRVAAGAYPEIVTVNKSVLLKGGGAGREAIRRTDPTKESIVGTTTGAFVLQANNVSIDGFMVQGVDRFWDAGIYSYPGFSGYKILNNIVQNNVAGLFMATNGATQSLVRGNYFNANNTADADAAFAPVGRGIIANATGGALSNVLIERNTFTGHNNAAMEFAGTLGTQTGLTIQRNTVTNDEEIKVMNTTNSTLSRNELFNAANGIILGGGDTNVTVSDNMITGGTRGIRVRNEAGFASPNTNNTIYKNTVKNNTNEGIYLEGADSNTLSRNTVTLNGANGIRLNASADNNVLSKNTARDNTTFDVRDQSNGAGTAGTSNLWSDTNCDFGSPVELCE